MPDVDLFENRFLPVYRAYVTEIPTQVDPAAVARSVATTPTRPMVGWPGAFRPAPALGWLVLCGLLMLATGAIAFVVGSNQHAIVPLPSPQASPSASLSSFTCPPGSKPNVPGPAAQARPPDSWSGTAVDWRTGRLILPVDDGIWTFDLCANTWHPSAAASNGGAPVFDADSGLTVVIGAEGPIEGGASVTSYDAVSDTSRTMGSAPAQGSWQAVYDPVSGLILARDKWTSRMWTYDVEGDAWSEITQAGDIPPDNPPEGAGQGPRFLGVSMAELLAYDSAADRLVLYVLRNGAFSQTYEFDPRTQQWTRQPIVTPVAGLWGSEERSEIAYDAANARTVISGGGVVAAYDATAHLWHSDLIPDKVFAAQVAMAYDPINERTVVGGGLLHGEVLAIDLTQRQWVILLAPVER